MPIVNQRRIVRGHGPTYVIARIMRDDVKQGWCATRWLKP